jgi:hypothetical protein
MFKSKATSIVGIILDSAALYSVTLLVTISCYAAGSSGYYIVLDASVPITSIAFYMVIIRVSHGAHQSRRTIEDPTSLHIISSNFRGNSQSEQEHKERGFISDFREFVGNSAAGEDGAV